MFLEVFKYYNTTGQHLKISLIALWLRDVTKVNGGFGECYYIVPLSIWMKLHTSSMPLLTERAWAHVVWDNWQCAGLFFKIYLFKHEKDPINYVELNWKNLPKFRCYSFKTNDWPSLAPPTWIAVSAISIVCALNLNKQKNE